MTYLTAAAMCWPVLAALLFAWGKNQKRIFDDMTTFELLRCAAVVAALLAFVWPVGLPFAISVWWHHR